MSEVREALIVAVDRYDDPKLRQLQAPAEDAEALRAVLADGNIGSYEVAFALNQREHELRRTLSRFFSDRRRDDLLLVHFSCHGVKDEDGDLYFAATDTSTDHLHATAIPAELVNRLMDRSASRRIVLMLDCCYGGAFRRGMRSRAGEGVDIKERLNGTGRVVLTASSAMEFAWEGNELHGGRRPSIFTSAVVDGLRTGKADIDRDQQVSVHDLYEYVYNRIRAETPQQTPLKFGLEEGPLYIARTHLVQAAPLPDDLKAAMENSLAAVREGAVHELESLLHESHTGVVHSARQALERMTEDDSRRVSAAAEAALESVPEALSAAPAGHPKSSEPARTDISTEPIPPAHEPSRQFSNDDQIHPTRSEAAPRHAHQGPRRLHSRPWGLSRPKLGLALVLAALSAAGMVLSIVFLSSGLRGTYTWASAAAALAACIAGSLVCAISLTVLVRSSARTSSSARRKNASGGERRT